jgi:hypothetical protein
MFSNHALFDLAQAGKSHLEPVPIDPSCDPSIRGYDEVASVFDTISKLLDHHLDDLMPSYPQASAHAWPLTPNITLLQKDLKSVFSSNEVEDHENEISSLRRGNKLSIESNDQSRSPDSAPVSGNSTSSPAYTVHQAGQWQQRFDELVQFKNEYGHCCVPSHWPQNSPLAQWVKRQRSQNKLKKEDKHSNMTDERENALGDLGFVWDSHAIFWEEKLSELFSFRDIHGHCNVPTKYPDNPKLAIWAKCQRRQFKLFTTGDKRSNMTLERLSKLSDAGFVLFNQTNLKNGRN